MAFRFLTEPKRKKQKAHHIMLSLTKTRYFASFTMTLVMWMACWVGAVAEEPFNPPPCKDPWVCKFPPSISGKISGTASLCPNQNGTWTVAETIIKGEKTRCEELPVKVPLRDVQWNWSITGPETHTGNGKSASKTLVKPGTYTVTFSGWGYADDPCDKNNPYTGFDTFSFTVEKLTPITNVSTILTQPDVICLDEETEGTCTIGDQSRCDAGPYTVKWKVEGDGGPQNLQFTPASGQFVLTFQQTVHVKFKIKAGPGAKGGTAKIKLTATVNGVDQTSSGAVSIFNPLSITHNKPVIKKWQSGENAQATLTYEGSSKDAKIVYSLHNVDTNEIQWTQTSSETTISVPIAKAGRYIIKAECCNRIFTASPVFTCFTITFTPKGRSEFKWDDNTSLEEQWREPESLTEKAIKQVDLGVKATDAATVYGSAVDANVEAAKKALETSVENLEASEVNLQQAAVDAGLERDAAQKAVDAATAKISDLKNTLDDVTAQIRQIENTHSQPYSAEIRQKLSSLRGVVRSINDTQMPAARDALRTAKAAIAPLIEKVATIQEAISYTAQRLETLRDGIKRFTTLLGGTGEMVAKFRVLKAHVSEMGRLAGESVIRLNRLVDSVKIPGFKVPALPVIGTVIDIIQVIQLFQETENLKTSLAKLDELSVKYKEVLEKLSIERKPGPLINKVTLETIPGRLPLSFREENITWMTKESPVGGRSVEKAWGWRHLVLIGDTESNYEAQYYSSDGATGELSIDLYAYGNLGTSYLFVDVADKKSQAAKQLACTGLTEEDMIKAAEVKFSAEANEWERVKHNVKAISTALTAGLGLGALVLLAVGSALAAPVAIIAAVVGVLAILVEIFVGWLSVSSFAKSIMFNYPEAN